MAEVVNKCKVCNKPVQEWYVVCSYACSGTLGGKKKGDELNAPKGFSANRELARTAGAIGGKLSKREKANG